RGHVPDRHGRAVPPPRARCRRNPPWSVRRLHLRLRRVVGAPGRRNVGQDLDRGRGREEDQRLVSAPPSVAHLRGMSTTCTCASAADTASTRGGDVHATFAAATAPARRPDLSGQNYPGIYITEAAASGA